MNCSTSAPPDGSPGFVTARSSAQTTIGHIPIDQLRKRVSELPAMPQAVHDVLAALRDDDVRMDECAQRVSRDQALVAQTLRLANSAFYGVPGRVATLQDAIQVLGLRTLATLLQTVALIGRLPPPTCRAFYSGEFWRNSIGTGLCAQALASRLGLDSNVAFTAGLLHDIGRLALATHFADWFAQASMLEQTEKLPPLEAERIVLGTDHAAVGALITTHWHYPAPIIEAIALHHQPSNRRGRGAATLCDVVHVADAVAAALTRRATGGNTEPPEAPPAWQALELGHEQYVRVLQQTTAGVDAMCSTLGL